MFVFLMNHLSSRFYFIIVNVSLDSKPEPETTTIYKNIKLVIPVRLLPNGIINYRGVTTSLRKHLIFAIMDAKQMFGILNSCISQPPNTF